MTESATDSHNDKTTGDDAPVTTKPSGKRLTVGLASLGITILAFIGLILLWPDGTHSLPVCKIDAAGNIIEASSSVATNGAETTATQCTPAKTGLKAKTHKLPFEIRMLYIILLSGALGSLVHTLSSFARHVGNDDYSDTWTWWYIMRIFIGMALAMIIYFALRGGFFAPTTAGGLEAKDIINPFGFATMAALAGMFSNQAVDKLKELFDAIFKVSKKRVPVSPKVSRLSPDSATAGQKGVALTIIGTNFEEKSIVQINGVVRKHKFLNSQALDVTLTKDDLAKKGNLQIFVLNEGKYGGTSNTVTYSIK